MNFLPWQQLRYGPHVGDLHVVAETCSSPHLAESLFPPAEGAHSCSCFGHGSPGGAPGHPPAPSKVMLCQVCSWCVSKALGDRITQWNSCFCLQFAFPAAGWEELSKSFTSSDSLSLPSTRPHHPLGSPSSSTCFCHVQEQFCHVPLLLGQLLVTSHLRLWVAFQATLIESRSSGA